jgi:hypothetical protein
LTSKEILIDDQFKDSCGFNSGYNRFRNSFNFQDEDEDDIYGAVLEDKPLSAFHNSLDPDDREIRDWKKINKPRLFKVICLNLNSFLIS